jgi:hypothetical protein
MRWLDVAGAPGSGKSTLCDREWPRKIELDGRPHPFEWHEFDVCAQRLAKRIKPEDGPDECLVIFERYVRKAATLSRRMTWGGVYVNTALAQAGLEIGWRLGGDAVAEYFELMPVSVGVAFLWADRGILERRNRERGRDRSHMIEGMERTQALALRTLHARRVPVASLDTRLPKETNRAALAMLAGA